MDQGGTAAAGCELDLCEEVDFAPLSLRPVGERLLVQQSPAGQVQAGSGLGSDEVYEVGKERPEKVFEDLVVEAPASFGEGDLRHAPYKTYFGAPI